jgi:hypothetical protein
MVSEMKALYKMTEVANPMKHEQKSEETCHTMSYNSVDVSSVSDTTIVNTCLVFILCSNGM